MYSNDLLVSMLGLSKARGRLRRLKDVLVGEVGSRLARSGQPMYSNDFAFGTVGSRSDRSAQKIVL